MYVVWYTSSLQCSVVEVVVVANLEERNLSLILYITGVQVHTCTNFTITEITSSLLVASSLQITQITAGSSIT